MSTSQITEQIIRYTVQGGAEALRTADAVIARLRQMNPSPQYQPIAYGALDRLDRARDTGAQNALLRSQAELATGRAGIYGRTINGLERLMSRRVSGDGGGTGLEKFAQFMKGNYVTQQGNIHSFTDAIIPKILGTTFLAYKTAQWTEELSRSGAEIKIVSAALSGLAGGAAKVNAVLAPFESALGGLLGHEDIKRTALESAQVHIAGATPQQIAQTEAGFIRLGRISHPEMSSQQLAEKFTQGVFRAREGTLESVVKGIDVHTALQKYLDAHDMAASEITEDMKATIAFGETMRAVDAGVKQFGDSNLHAGDALLGVSVALENFKSGLVEGITQSPSFQQLTAGLNKELPQLISGVVAAGKGMAYLASLVVEHPGATAALFAGRAALGVGATLGGLATAGSAAAISIPLIITAVVAAVAYYMFSGSSDTKTPAGMTQTQMERDEQKERAASTSDVGAGGSGGAGGAGGRGASGGGGYTGITYSGNSQEALDFSGGTGISGPGAGAGGGGAELDPSSKQRISAQAQKLSLVAKAIDATGDAIIDGLTDLLEAHSNRLRADINSMTQG